MNFKQKVKIVLTDEETTLFKRRNNKKFEVIIENNEEALRNFQEKSARISGTLFWTRDLSNFPRITQKLISRYSKNEVNINLKVINFLRNNIANKKAKRISLKEREYGFS